MCIPYEQCPKIWKSQGKFGGLDHSAWFSALQLTAQYYWMVSRPISLDIVLHESVLYWSESEGQANTSKTSSRDIGWLPIQSEIHCILYTMLMVLSSSHPISLDIGCSLVPRPSPHVQKQTNYFCACGELQGLGMRLYWMVCLIGNTTLWFYECTITKNSLSTI